MLYTIDKDAPNASIRVLIGMMIIKEGQGCNALGLMALEGAVPGASIYYLSRRNLVKYAKENQEDLFKKCQVQITKSRILQFNVIGKQVRMDSKLMGSNIAWYSRYELIHETLRMFISERLEFIYKKRLSKEEFSLIESIEGETGNKVVYRSTKLEIDARLIALGKLMYRFIGLFKANNYG